MRVRALEWFVICVALPVGAAFLHWKTDIPLMPVKCALLVLAFVLVWRDPSFDRRNLLRFEVFRARWKSILLRFLALASVLGILMAVFSPAEPFAFPRQNPGAWLLFAVLAPLFPAYPEEFLFRVFFFQRYGSLWKRPALRILASAAAFSLAHLYLANVWAVGLSFLGGLLFAQTYESSRSAALASLEHGLWAAYLFTIGLGPFFYPGLR